ncbi:hypothetical protein GCM10010466_00510 [Planomonospora alba]|uniref:Uncharacterized protein n=1 Tax=Planomonospora alba TaxID=161354 RepID=A0ABP6MIR2_9ACTN
MRSAISAGALALALGGGLSVVATASAGAAHAADCDKGGGLLGGVTGGLCQAVDGVTNAVDGLTGSVLSPVTEGLDQTTEKVLKPLGQAVPTAKPKATPGSGGASAKPPSEPEGKDGSGGPGRDGGGVLPDLLDVCVSVGGGCGGSPASSAPEQSTRPAATARPRPGQSRRPETDRERPGKKDREDREKEGSQAPLPSHFPARPRQPEPRTHTTEVRDPVLSEQPAVDVEAPRVEPLWPGPLIQELQQRMPEERAVTPSRSSDPAGTALTAALLAAAVLAVRLMYARRADEESIPFEPLRVGRHRVA